MKWYRIIKLLIGGSPCTYWSIAQSKTRETAAGGIGWDLFCNYRIAKKKFCPDLFLYENNKSAAPAIKEQIAVELGAPLQYINSALVSAQSRQRFYCHNFGDVPQPADRGILLRDILESGIADKEKAYCLKHQAGNTRDYFKKHHTQIVLEYVGGLVRIGDIATTADAHRVYSSFGKARTLKANAGGQGGKTGLYLIPVPKALTGLVCDKGLLYCVENGKMTNAYGTFFVNVPDGCYLIRKLSVTECCRLQTLPDDYCRAVSPTQAYKGLGNGWTAEVIIHLLSHALQGIPKKEELVVLSMYDGIGTGRYCLDKLGYCNVTYFATEIDPYAMKTAMSNYPDIIQLGDAFDVRADGWALSQRSLKKQSQNPIKEAVPDA